MLGNGVSFPSKFSHMPMKLLADYVQTYNVITAAFATDGSDNDCQATGTGGCIIGGVPTQAMGATAALDISADIQLGIWITATAYTAVNVKYVADDNGNKQWFKCIASHTSSAATKPGQPDHVNATWRTYWTESSNLAVQASGDVVASGDSMYYLALQTAAADSLTTVLASDKGVLDADIVLKIPQFDPTIFVAVGLLLINSAGYTHGTTSSSGISTYTQLIGPTFPHGSRLGNLGDGL